jgi:hypothetical protein
MVWSVYPRMELCPIVHISDDTWMNMVFENKFMSLTLCPQIQYILPRKRTRVYAMRGWRLAAPSTVLIVLRDRLRLSALSLSAARAVCHMGVVWYFRIRRSRPPYIDLMLTPWLTHRNETPTAIFDLCDDAFLSGVSDLFRGCPVADCSLIQSLANIKLNLRSRDVSEKLSCAASQDISCVVLKDSLPCSQEPVTWACPEPDFFLWRASQQMLRTHHSLEAYCAALWCRWLAFSFFRVMEHRWNEIYRGKPKYSGENLSKCQFVHHKSHTDWPGIKPGSPRWEAGD